MQLTARCGHQLHALPEGGRAKKWFETASQGPLRCRRAHRGGAGDSQKTVDGERGDTWPLRRLAFFKSFAAGRCGLCVACCMGRWLRCEAEQVSRYRGTCTWLKIIKPLSTKRGAKAAHLDEPSRPSNAPSLHSSPRTRAELDGTAGPSCDYLQNGRSWSSLPSKFSSSSNARHKLCPDCQSVQG